MHRKIVLYLEILLSTTREKDCNVVAVVLALLAVGKHLQLKREVLRLAIKALDGHGKDWRAERVSDFGGGGASREVVDGPEVAAADLVLFRPAPRFGDGFGVADCFSLAGQRHLDVRVEEVLWIENKQINLQLVFSRENVLVLFL